MCPACALQPLSRLHGVTTWQRVSGGYELFDATSTEEFFALLDVNGDNWGWDNALGRPEWIFRGQSDAEWPLLPPAWRDINRPPAISVAVDWTSDHIPAELVVQQLDGRGTAFPPNLDGKAARAIVVQANAELALISEFVHRADALGLQHMPLRRSTGSRGATSGGRP